MHTDVNPGPRVERQPADGACPGCGKAELSRYPVLSEGGWYQVVKCGACLHSVSRKPWGLLGPITLTSHGLVLD
ncbi:hypothetical protein LWC35_03135 [Pseudonocardia kujensis]|uniref:hypothetical protein n=1 Tax=Pseudonocardia kujensis TaxID=1128675 RepID=UPI001E2CC18B|nr:hypothetical protein [Pseudonocardia kujensis]MCE0761910.1 hypothetical protein [Pseudonocardia kujensis]